MDNELKTQSIAPDGFDASCFGEEVELWMAQNLSERWYQDALNAARDTSNTDCRQEIIFCCACIETFLYEWARNNFDKDVFECVFESTSRDGLQERWKNVLKHFHKRNYIEKPDFNKGKWPAFTRFIKFRDSLLHGSYARLYHVSNDSDSYEAFLKLKSGAAVNATTDLIEELCTSKINSKNPAWCSEFLQKIK